MSPVKVPYLCLAHTSQLLLNIASLALLVVMLHPKPEEDTDAENHGCRCQVDPVANGEVRPVFGNVAPGCDETADITHHDLNDGEPHRWTGVQDMDTYIQANGTAPRSIADAPDVGTGLGVGHWPHDH